MVGGIKTSGSIDAAKILLIILDPFEGFNLNPDFCSSSEIKAVVAEKPSNS
jgi:hypothetical protein